MTVSRAVTRRNTEPYSRVTDTAAVPNRISGATAAPEPKARRFAQSNAPSRTELQQFGSATLLRHFRRSLIRFAVLTVADLAITFLFGLALLALTKGKLLGGRMAAVLEGWLPTGYVGALEIGVAVLLGLIVAGNYGQGDQRKDIGRLFGGVALGIAFIVWRDVFELGLIVPIAYAVVVIALWIALSLERYVLDRIIQALGWRRPHMARTVFVGPIEECHAAATGAAFGSKSQYRVVGFVDLAPAGVAESVAELRHSLVQRNAEVVVVCGYLEPRIFGDVVDAARDAGCRLLAVSRRFRQTGVEPNLVWEQGQPLIQLSAPELKGRQLVIKRVMDILGAGVGLVLLSPVFTVIAVAIKLDSDGPVFFGQERVGYGGRVFRLLKFRTMRDGADDEKGDIAHLNYTGDPRLFKIPNDPRVTRIGAWLRRWSIDELPQLWNVLRGDMSVVGPRPFFEVDLVDYLDHHFSRLGAKPGITGLWQVRGRSEIVEFEEVVRLDREYIDRWSVWLDLRILLETIPAVVRRTGAY